MRRHLGTILAIALVVVVFGYVLPKVANYREVLDLLQSIDSAHLALLAFATILNILTFAPPWMAALPNLSFRHALVMTQSSTALSTAVPGGDAVGMGLSYKMLRVWGFERPAVALALALTAAWNVIANILLPIIAVVLLAAQGEVDRTLRLAAIVGGIGLLVVGCLVAFAYRSDENMAWLGRLIERLAHRPARMLRREPPSNMEEAAVSARRQSLDLVRRRWHVLTLASLAGHLSVFFVLEACLIALDVTGVSLLEAFAAWGFIRLITTIPITPAGLGVVELGLTGLLVAFGGNQAEVVAAVLLYRVLTLVPPVALGALCVLIWRRMNPVVDDEPEPAAVA